MSNGWFLHHIISHPGWSRPGGPAKFPAAERLCFKHSFRNSDGLAEIWSLPVGSELQNSTLDWLSIKRSLASLKVNLDRSGPNKFQYQAARYQHRASDPAKSGNASADWSWQFGPLQLPLEGPTTCTCLSPARIRQVDVYWQEGILSLHDIRISFWHLHTSDLISCLTNLTTESVAETHKIT